MLTVLSRPLHPSRFQKAVGVAAMAENAAKEAEAVRDAAVAEREAAVHEAEVIRKTMKVR